MVSFEAHPPPILVQPGLFLAAHGSLPGQSGSEARGFRTKSGTLLVPKEWAASLCWVLATGPAIKRLKSSNANNDDISIKYGGSTEGDSFQSAVRNWRNVETPFKNYPGTSLVAQWLRIHLPMQGTRVRALVREDPTCRRATKPMRHN